MSSQHLSDEAIAAFADAVLAGAARERATRHVNGCPECARAVAVQREAISALRAAAAPSLPGGLLDRLRHVPTTTPLDLVPTALGPDGSTMLRTFGTVGPARPASPASFGPVALTVAALAAAGLLAAGSVAHDARGGAAPALSHGSTVLVPSQFGPAGPDAQTADYLAANERAGRADLRSR